MKSIMTAGAVCALLTACAPRDAVLPGERVDLRDGMAGNAAAVENQAVPISLPAPRANADWTHRGGSVTHSAPHLAFSAAPSLLFSADIGAGDSRRARISADPVASSSAIYTLDAASAVTAIGTNGATLWSVNLTPTGESSAAFGGGVALASGTVYATTGYGELIALDSATGAIQWRQDLNAPGAGAPTVANGLVYVVSRDSRGWAVNAETGRVEWTVDSIPSNSSFGGGSSVAVTSELALFPFSSGEMIATFRRGGHERWNTHLVGNRLGRATATITELSGDPVVDGSTVYVGNSSGRMTALNLATGTRKWTATEGAINPVVVAGGSVFAVNDINELVRLSAASGDVIWRTSLPDLIERRLGKSRAAVAHYGPLLAGGRLIVASSDGMLRAFDPVSGAQTSAIEMPAGAASQPIIVNGTLYVVTKNGKLLAFR